MSSNSHILVIGAAGGVGRLVCREVIRQLGPGELTVGDYRGRRARDFARALGEKVSWRVVDVRDEGSVRSAIHNVDAAIVACKQKEPLVQTACMESRIPCLDITPFADLIEKAKALHERALSQHTALVMGAGLFPGLSGVMAKHASGTRKNVESVHVGMLQNSAAVVGPAGIASMLGVFAKPVRFHNERTSSVKPGFTVQRTFQFPEPYGRKALRLIKYDEASVVAEKCDVPNVNYWTGFEKIRLNAILAFLNKLGILKLFNNERIGIRLAKIINSLKRKGPPQPETIAIAVDINMSVVAMARLILSKDVKAQGVCFPLEVFPLYLLLDTIGNEDVKIFEESNGP
jgi:saccharopine dehydrogenase-like NADP-dependent oxidoreductase